MSIELRSPAFGDGETIPQEHTKDGADVSPPLRWSGVPEGTVELALSVEDPDAPAGTFVHWLVAGLDPALEGLESGQLPETAVEGRNDFGDEGYGGPRPPEGDPAHRYVFTLFALDKGAGLAPGASSDEFHDAVQGKEAGRGQLIGRFGR